jgi:hypothetical protein
VALRVLLAAGLVAALEGGGAMTATAKPSAGPFLYNPALMPREELIASFLVRHAELEEVLRQVRAAQPQHAPQHVLVIGFRGMGKTTLLHRVAYAVEEDPELSRAWLPVLFDEEQFNVGELADFWLNALDVLGVAIGQPETRRTADELTEKYRGEALEEAAFAALRDLHLRLDRRFLLLVDNMDLIFDRIGSDREASRLREVLQHESWVLLVGSSSRVIEATYEYGQPFYEMFKVIELHPLDEQETLHLLAGLAERYGAVDVTGVVKQESRKLGKLRLLMGGNPRTVGLLFGVLKEGPTEDLRAQLERLLDSCTSLYKDRLESLPVQAQRVFDALAQRWDPATAADIAGDLRLSRGVTSGQLHRLVDKGLVEKVNHPARAIGFQVRERFFNIWCLMRGGRRGRRRLRWLVEFVGLFYDLNRIEHEVKRLQQELSAATSSSQFSATSEVAQVLASALDPSSQSELFSILFDDFKRFPELRDSVDPSDLRQLVLSDELSRTKVVELAAQLYPSDLFEPEVWWCYVSASCAIRHLRLVNLTSLVGNAEVVLSKKPHSIEARLALGWLCFFSTNFERAEKIAKEIVKIDSARGLTLLVQVCLATGRTGEALGAFEQAVLAGEIEQELLVAFPLFRLLAMVAGVPSRILEPGFGKDLRARKDWSRTTRPPLTLVALTCPGLEQKWPESQMFTEITAQLPEEVDSFLPVPVLVGLVAARLARDREWQMSVELMARDFNGSEFQRVAEILLANLGAGRLAESAVSEVVVGLTKYLLEECRAKRDDGLTWLILSVMRIQGFTGELREKAIGRIVSVWVKSKEGDEWNDQELILKETFLILAGRKEARGAIAGVSDVAKLVERVRQVSFPLMDLYGFIPDELLRESPTDEPSQ